MKVFSIDLTIPALFPLEMRCPVENNCCHTQIANMNPLTLLAVCLVLDDLHVSLVKLELEVV